MAEALGSDGDAILARVGEEARRFLGGLDERPVKRADALDRAEAFGGELAETGIGDLAAVEELIAGAEPALVASAGPRFFHLVVGGVTPAALGADWLTSLWDQVAASTVTSPLAVRIEEVAVAWLRELFGLPPGAGVLTTGGHGGNLLCLLAARQWWGERHGVDPAEHGLAGLPPMPVLSSGLVHASALKALAQIGAGRRAVQRFERDATGALDLAALERALRELGGAPAVIVANAGDVNAGAFDPIDALADLAAEHGAWLHVDGAFGLFARVSPRTAHLASGVERAHSVASDCHKWLNVPYDCGVGFLRERALLARVNRLAADYLPREWGERGAGERVRGSVLSNLSVESSRRARGFAVWATLRANGRSGIRAAVERNLDHAQRLARLVDEAPELERLAEVPLDIVCFRARPRGVAEGALDELNARLGHALQSDGRVIAGTTRYANRVALRAAFVNYRTRDSDVDLLVAVVRELLAKLVE